LNSLICPLQKCLNHISAIGLPQVVELKNKFSNVVDFFYQILEHQQLIEIMIESTDSFSEKNFDRITLLLEIYNSRVGSFIGEIKVNLSRIEDELLNRCNSTND
jgi:50S ribosomal subunit-associated GTPase HflX